jgi:hypothetical protein
MRRMQGDLDAIGESGADEEAETLAGERIQSGAAEHTRDGAEVLAELGIQTDWVVARSVGGRPTVSSGASARLASTCGIRPPQHKGS